MTSQPNTAFEPVFAASDADARADRGRRDVVISDAHVTINRRFQGIDMHLALALSAFRGDVAEATPDSCDAETALPRRHRPLKNRPKFLARRKIGATADALPVHADEREIIARD